MQDFTFFSNHSGLTPASKYTLSDHQLAYYRLQSSLPNADQDASQSVTFGTVGEYGWLKGKLAISGNVNLSMNDLRTQLYALG